MFSLSGLFSVSRPEVTEKFGNTNCCIAVFILLARTGFGNLENVLFGVIEKWVRFRKYFGNRFPQQFAKQVSCARRVWLPHRTWVV